MVCYIFMSVLSQLPALVRQWWSNKEARIAQIVERITATYVSQQLCVQELTDVAQHETKFKNMVVTIKLFASIYFINEQFEICIAFKQYFSR